MATLTPRAVFVARETDYELLIARHATRDQARFFLESRGQRIETLEARHHSFHAALALARAAVPGDWRQALVHRADLDRFLFAPDDLVIPIGQDGLVANVAKYLNGQAVIGVNPAPDLYDGLLVRITLDRLAEALRASQAERAVTEQRTMVQAQLESGETLTALNEIFVGHRSHQSARYHIQFGDKAEAQSSSGLIVASGTGATGWARSIAAATHLALSLDNQERAVGYWVREPFPSRTSATNLRAGKITATPLRITSQMNDGGVIFADGIEQDFIPFDWGRCVHISPAPNALRLVVN